MHTALEHRHRLSIRQYKLGAPRVLVQDEQPDRAVNGIWEAFLDAASCVVQDGQAPGRAYLTNPAPGPYKLYPKLEIRIP